MELTDKINYMMIRMKKNRTNKDTTNNPMKNIIKIMRNNKINKMKKTMEDKKMNKTIIIKIKKMTRNMRNIKINPNTFKMIRILLINTMVKMNLLRMMLQKQIIIRSKKVKLMMIKTIMNGT